MSLTAEQREARFREVRALRDGGATYNEIAKHFGIAEATIAAWFSNERAKQSAAAAIVSRLARCLNCRAEFRSEGAHNRMCRICRRISASPMTPDPGGDTGRRIGGVRGRG